MTELATFRFIMPGWLLLLPLLWWLVWLLDRHNLRPSMWNRICDPRLLENLRTDEGDSSDRGWLVWPLTIMLTLAILAAAGPSWRQQAHPLMESAGARIIALDLSRAMLVQDVRPNRFTQAIAATREIISAGFEGETGLLVFSGAAFVVSPLSRDANTLLAFIDALEPGIMPLEGIRVDLAITRAQELLRASTSGRGQIVVITSGTERNSNAVQAATAARLQGHQVSIMAIGTRAGGPLIDQNGALLRDGHDKPRLARTGFAELEQVASAGGGILIRLTETTAVDQLLRSRIMAGNLLEATRGAGNDDRAAANDGIWLVWLLLPFALLLFRRNLFWIVVVALWLPPGGEVYAAEQDSIWLHREWQAFEAYRQGDFERAGELSADPMLKGSAHYRRGQYRQALEAFGMDDSAQSHYNRGNVLTRLNRLPEAIAAYSHALTLDPALGQARYNKRLLEIFLERLEDIPGEQSGEPGDDSGNPESLDQSGSENRLGIVGQELNNPGDEDTQGPGFGASIQSGQPNPFDQYDGREQQLDRFSLEQGIDREQAEILVERWVKDLPTASSELFRRKFLRDYQRQRRQPR